MSVVSDMITPQKGNAYTFVGRGHFQRMKDIMEETVVDARHHMFSDSAAKTESELDIMALEIRKNLIQELSKVKEAIASNYGMAVEKLAEEKPCPAEIEIKTKISEVIESSELEFRKIMGVGEGVSDEETQEHAEAAELQDKPEEEKMAIPEKQETVFGDKQNVKAEEPQSVGLSQIDPHEGTLSGSK
jgi:hypothetical protein